MSTNYYVRTADTPADAEGIHLGKYAAGSAFMFRAHFALGVTDYDSWLTLAQSGQIVAEHGGEVTVDELVDLVDDARRQWGRHMRWARPYPNQFDDANGNRFTDQEFC